MDGVNFPAIGLLRGNFVPRREEILSREAGTSLGVLLLYIGLLHAHVVCLEPVPMGSLGSRRPGQEQGTMTLLVRPIILVVLALGLGSFAL